jgi:hypothetical protein
MDFHGPGHVFPCVPPVLGNHGKLESPVVVGLRFVSGPDLDRNIMAHKAALGEESPAEVQTKLTLDLIRSKVAYVKGLTVDGIEIADFDALYEKAPREFYAWVCQAIYSTQILTDAELKNS